MVSETTIVELPDAAIAQQESSATSTVQPTQPNYSSYQPQQPIINGSPSSQPQQFYPIHNGYHPHAGHHHPHHPHHPHAHPHHLGGYHPAHHHPHHPHHPHHVAPHIHHPHNATAFINPHFPPNYQPSQLTSLYVGDLASDVNEVVLNELFSKVGRNAIASIHVCRDSNTYRSLGYAYVNFYNNIDAERALDTLNYSMVHGKPCRIMWSYRDPTKRKTNIGNVFVKNLEKTVDNAMLYDIFSSFGNILSCKVEYEKGVSKGYGYVHFETSDSSEKAIEKINGTLYLNKPIFCEPFVAKVERYKVENKVFFRNADESVTQEMIYEELSKFGEIETCTLKIDSNGKSKGLGTVEFKNSEDAQKLLAIESDQIQINGKPITFDRVKNKIERVTELRKKTTDQTLFLSNIDESIEKDAIKEEFSKHGSIIGCKIVQDEQGKNKGFGFITFSEVVEAQKALDALNGHTFGTKQIQVTLSSNKDHQNAISHHHNHQQHHHQQHHHHHNNHHAATHHISHKSSKYILATPQHLSNGHNHTHHGHHVSNGHHHHHPKSVHAIPTSATSTLNNNNNNNNNNNGNTFNNTNNNNNTNRYYNNGQQPVYNNQSIYAQSSNPRYTKSSPNSFKKSNNINNNTSSSSKPINGLSNGYKGNKPRSHNNHLNGGKPRYNKDNNNSNNNNTASVVVNDQKSTTTEQVVTVSISTTLTLESILKLTSEEAVETLGSEIFNLILTKYQNTELAGKITGMIIESAGGDSKELFSLIETGNIQSKIEEGKKLLDETPSN